MTDGCDAERELEELVAEMDVSAVEEEASGILMTLETGPWLRISIVGIGWVDVGAWELDMVPSTSPLLDYNGQHPHTK